MKDAGTVMRDLFDGRVVNLAGTWWRVMDDHLWSSDTDPKYTSFWVRRNKIKPKEPVHDIHWAIDQVLSGNLVRCVDWNDGLYLGLDSEYNDDVKTLSIIAEIKGDIIDTAYRLDYEDICSTNWELYDGKANGGDK